MGLATTTFAQAQGEIDTTYKYAWSENAGWIVFRVPNGNVLVTDNTITGYVWSPSYGWINLAPTQGGVTNTPNGDVGGHAWGENFGWIDFSGATIDSSGFFWGYIDGDVIGKTTLNCGNTNSCGVFDFKVKTNWVPERFRPDYEGDGGGGDNAIEKYWWGPDRTREEFRGHYDAGTTKLTFDKEYKKSLEHAIQIDMGVQGKVQEYVREDGREKFAQYIPGRLPMDALDGADGSRDRIVYRREWPDRPTVDDYFTTAPKGEGTLEDEVRRILERKGKIDLYDKARERIYQKTLENEQATEDKPYPTKGQGVRQYLNREDEMRSVQNARKRQIQAEKERQELFEKLRKDLLGPERYQQLKEEMEKHNGTATPLNQNLMDTIFKYLETNIFDFFR